MRQTIATQQQASRLLELGMSWSATSPRPFLNEAAVWLRDVHGLHCYCYPTPLWQHWICAIHNRDKGGGWHKIGDYDTPDTALSAAIDAAIGIVEERLK